MDDGKEGEVMLIDWIESKKAEREAARKRGMDEFMQRLAIVRKDDEERLKRLEEELARIDVPYLTVGRKTAVTGKVPLDGTDGYVYLVNEKGR